jgi:prophage regulatory protein
VNTTNTILLRKPTVLSMTGFGTTTLYERIKAGLFTRPIRIGARLSAWRASEVDEINRAIVAGKTDAEIRDLVKTLENARVEASRGQLSS